MKTVLTIAGSDSSGGAGIQADIKTMMAHGVYAMSAITAITAQNTTGVFGIQEITAEILEKQIEAVATDIMPDAVKTGMISTKDQVEVVVNAIQKYNFKNVIVDPVIISSTGTRLINDDAIIAIKEKLFPIATLITPNIPEVEYFFRKFPILQRASQVFDGVHKKTEYFVHIDSETKMEKAAELLSKVFGCAVLIKGGHAEIDADDFLYENDGKSRWYRGKKIDNPNTHGTGCTLSAAICSNLAKGSTLQESIRDAKRYITGALEANLDLGKGSGPLAHDYAIAKK